MPSASNSVTARPVATARAKARRSAISTPATGRPKLPRAWRAAAISGARAGHSLSTRAAGTPAARTISTALPTAARSNIDGRQGMRTASAVRAICGASGLAWGALSTISRPMPSCSAAATTRRSSPGEMVATIGGCPCRATPQVVALRCGSVSAMATRSPASPAATARCTARVVLPVPPFWLKRASV